MANTGLATEDLRYLDLQLDRLSGIEQKISGLISTTTDFSAASNGAWRTIAVDNLVITGQTAPTAGTITSTSVNVRGAAEVTVYVDITGATTGVVVTVRGGVSGFAMFDIRSVTASAGQYAFVMGEHQTGANANVTGVNRFDDVNISLSLAANSGAGTGVTTTLRTRFLTSPVIP